MNNLVGGSDGALQVHWLFAPPLVEGSGFIQGAELKGGLTPFLRLWYPW